MLKARKVNVFYEGIHALKGVDIEMTPKSIVSIIGANGAGKSTLLKSIMQLVPVKSGQISFKKENLMRLLTQDIVKLGISMVPEGRMLFTHLTVKDNLSLGAYLHYRMIGRKEVRQRMEKVFELFPVLQERKKQLSGTLSGGQQQMLAIGRALMLSPELLILDEPSMGLAPLVVREIFGVIKYLNEQGMSILMVEQNARAALKISHAAYVLEVGEVVGSGSGESLLSDEKIKKAYLGH